MYYYVCEFIQGEEFPCIKCKHDQRPLYFFDSDNFIFTQSPTILSDFEIRTYLKIYLKQQIEEHRKTCVIQNDFLNQINETFIQPDDGTFPADLKKVYAYHQGFTNLKPQIEEQILEIEKITAKTIYLKNSWLGRKTIKKSDFLKNFYWCYSTVRYSEKVGNIFKDDFYERFCTHSKYIIQCNFLLNNAEQIPIE